MQGSLFNQKHDIKRKRFALFCLATEQENEGELEFASGFADREPA